AGVPATSISSGIDVIGKPEGWGRARVDEWIAKHYHQPSDELGEDWDFSGMVEDARLGFLAGLRIAEAQEMPRWKPGDEFEAARKRALDSLQ
ncbi:MAG TPA: peptidase M28, partial [Anaeromyxobacteraceae bacterium]